MQRDNANRSTTKKKQRKKTIRVGPPLTKLSGSAHAKYFTTLCIININSYSNTPHLWGQC